MKKIWCGNILSLRSYCDFRVGVFYFGSPCIAAICRDHVENVNVIFESFATCVNL